MLEFLAFLIPEHKAEELIVGNSFDLAGNTLQQRLFVQNRGDLPDQFVGH